VPAIADIWSNFPVFEHYEPAQAIVIELIGAQFRKGFTATRSASTLWNRDQANMYNSNIIKFQKLALRARKLCEFFVYMVAGIFFYKYKEKKYQKSGKIPKAYLTI